MAHFHNFYLQGRREYRDPLNIRKEQDFSVLTKTHELCQHYLSNTVHLSVFRTTAHTHCICTHAYVFINTYMYVSVYSLFPYTKQKCTCGTLSCYPSHTVLKKSSQVRSLAQGLRCYRVVHISYQSAWVRFLALPPNLSSLIIFLRFIYFY